LFSPTDEKIKIKLLKLNRAKYGWIDTWRVSSSQQPLGLGHQLVDIVGQSAVLGGAEIIRKLFWKAHFIFRNALFLNVWCFLFRK
jgi:hypothetical protein